MKVTAGAAAALILDPAARAVQDSAQEAYEEAEAEAQAQGQAQDGPVGRAKERWKEARNEMPEVLFTLEISYLSSIRLVSSSVRSTGSWRGSNLV